MAYDAIDAEEAALLLLNDVKHDASPHKNYERFS